MVINSIRVMFFVLCWGVVAAQPASDEPQAELSESDESDISAAQAPPQPGDGPAAETEAQPPASWFETRLAIEDSANAGDFEAALSLAESLIELTTEEFGPESDELAEAYLLIASVNKRNGEFTAAETNILLAIDVYAEREGPLSPVLIDPFLDLGETYDDAGDYAAAISAYGEARTIGRRHFGLLNESQLDIMDAMTAAAERLGDIEEAKELQLDAMTLVQRSYGEFSLEAIDARYKYAEWLRRARMADEARGLYFEILKIVNDQYNSDPLMTVRVLRERAYSYQEEDSGDSLGISGLRDALEYLEELPDPPWLEFARLHRDIGDWQVEFSPSRGMVGSEDYLSAWDYLGRVPGGEELRREWFGQLTVIEMNPISNRGLSTDPDAPRGHVEIHFTVEGNGRARDIEVVDSYPPGFKDSAFIRQIRDAHFRPRIENGVIVPFRHARLNEFRFDPEAVQQD